MDVGHRDIIMKYPSQKVMTAALNNDIITIFVANVIFHFLFILSLGIRWLDRRFQNENREREGTEEIL